MSTVATRQRGIIPAAPDDVWDTLTSGLGAARWLRSDPSEPLTVGSTVRLRYRPLPGAVRSLDHELRTFSVDFGDSRARVRLVPHQREGGAAVSTSIRVVECGSANGAVVAEVAWKVAIGAAFLACWGAIGIKEPRQALVFVHGIGEQHPGTTSRAFADGIFGPGKYMSKPDRVSGSYELRRLQVEKDEANDIPRTDVFELYWGDKIRDTELSQVIGWLLRLLRRRKHEVSSQLRPLQRLVRFATLFSLAVLALLFVVIGPGGFTALFEDLSGIAQLWWVSALLGLILGAITGWLVSSLGDATRYLSSHPDNIQIRTNIRDAGIELLRRLHQGGNYHRVVVAGHSLGSVVAYDVLLHYWAAVNTEHGRLDDPDNDSIESYEQGAPGASGEAHQRLQHDLWKGLRANGVPWLVTDFVTVGSPLAHAGTLVAASPDDLASLQKSRVLAACPPAADEASEDHPYSYRWTYLSGQGTPGIRILHHAALYGPTRWTNVYAPAKWGLLGDVIGGPVAPAFGNGVVDVPVFYRKLLTRCTLKAHTAYWSTQATTDGVPAAEVLRDALRAASLTDLEAFADTRPLRTFLDPDDGLL